MGTLQDAIVMKIMNGLIILWQTMNMWPDILEDDEWIDETVMEDPTKCFNQEKDKYIIRR